MMSLAGTGAGFGFVGGSCPDCHQPLDAESVYVACKYDISVAEIAKGNYGPTVVNNILAAQRAGKVTLTPEELNLLSRPQPTRIPRNAILQFILKGKKLQWLILVLLALAAIMIIGVFVSESTLHRFGITAIVRSTVLQTAAPGSNIISAQTVTQNGLQLWCVVTENKTIRQNWIVSGSTTETSAVSTIMEAVLPSRFADLGCTNWGGVSVAAPLVEIVPKNTGVPPTPSMGLMLTAYEISLPYDPSIWSDLNNVLVLQGLPDCQVWGAETIYNVVPDKPADIKVDDGNLAYEAYLNKMDVTTGAAYFIRSGIPSYDFTSEGSIPVVLYVNSNTATWDVCGAAVETLIKTFLP
jgi:hypothetical protein